jgi:hypothetical protein
MRGAGRGGALNCVVFWVGLFVRWSLGKVLNTPEVTRVYIGASAHACRRRGAVSVRWQPVVAGWGA